MRDAQFAQRIAVFLSVTGLCMPQAALAAQLPANRPPVVTDVALCEGGTLLGQVVDAQGAPLAGVQVALRSGDQHLGTSKTDEGGYFAFRGLLGGVYQVLTAESHAAFRLWPSGTAPPAARQTALIVADSGTLRGQYGRARLLRDLLASPWVVAAIVATAVAVPVAIHNQNLDKHPAS